MKEILTPENIKRVFEKFNFSNEDDMYAAVGYNGITAAQIANRLTEKQRRKREQEDILEETVKELNAQPVKRKKKDAGVQVEGHR